MYNRTDCDANRRVNIYVEQPLCAMISTSHKCLHRPINHIRGRFPNFPAVVRVSYRCSRRIYDGTSPTYAHNVQRSLDNNARATGLELNKGADGNSFRNFPTNGLRMPQYVQSQYVWLSVERTQVIRVDGVRCAHCDRVKVLRALTKCESQCPLSLLEFSTQGINECA